MAVLVLVASGWRPRLTALPHAYISFSVFTGIAVVDGGDQIATIHMLLLVLPALGDGRRWHWQTPRDYANTRARRVLALVGTSGLVVARLQMSFLYFQAAIAKLPHAEWADGSAMYYWANDLSFGAPGWLHPVLGSVVSTPVGVAALTWGPILIEISLAATLLLPQRNRWVLLVAGTTFHLAIGVMMGLWSFVFSMWGGLVLLCLPLGATLHRRQLASADPEPEADSGDSDRHERTSVSVSSSDSPVVRASTAN